MKNNWAYIHLILFVSALFFVACGKKNDENTNNTTNELEGFTKITHGSTADSKVKVEMWSKSPFFVGYNEIKIVLQDGTDPSKVLTDKEIMLMPMMTMNMMGSTHQHSCPVESPAKATNGVYAGAAVFSMPTSGDGFWEMIVKVKTDAGFTECKMPITVVSKEPVVFTSFKTNETIPVSLFLTMIQPASPKVGMNDIEFSLHKKQDMMNFPAESGYTIEIEPEMPSMGHGSPNNVNPVHTEKGHFKGKVNFTMTGEWKINVVVKKDGVAVSKDLAFIVKF
jgi:hypothetical protein